MSIIKKFIAILMIAALCITGAAFAEGAAHGEEVVEEAMPAEAAVYEGKWQCDRATVSMDWEEEGFKVLIIRANGASETTEWEYSCYYHENDRTLVSMPFGLRTEVVYNADGTTASFNQVYEDGEAVFSLDEEGHLIWQDLKDNAGEGLRFAKIPGEPADIPA